MSTKQCEHCEEFFSARMIKRHQNSCDRHPKFMKECPVCKKLFSSKNSRTCSYSCSNTLFRSGENNPNWKPDSYRSTCFSYHRKKCLVCEEEKIVAVHHVNEDRSDNRPENLVPLCPTHHQYVHSSYRNEVQGIIEEYLKNFRA